MQFRRKGEGLAIPAIVKRLVTDPVTCAEGLLPLRIPNHQREIAVDMRQTIAAPNFVGPEHEFGVGAVAQHRAPP